MQKIKLDIVMKNLQGVPMIDRSGEIVTIKNLLLVYCSGFQSMSGNELFAAMDIGQRIFQAEKVIEITEEEIKILKKVLKQPQHVAIVYTQLIQSLGFEDIL